MKDFKEVRYENGLKVLTIPKKGTRAMVVLVLVKTGSKDEVKEKMGISHFLEHMLFKGTEKRKTPLDVAESLDKVGGVYNAFTSEDFTGYYAKVDKDKFDLAIDWVSDIYLNSILPEAEIEKEKGVISEEINMIYDNPMTYTQVLWERLLYGDQPAGWDIAGSKESVAGINKSDLLDYLKAQYSAENTLVVISGAISHKQGQKKALKYFSSINQESPRKRKEVIEHQEVPEVELLKRETDQTHLAIGVRGYNDSHPDRYIQEVLATLLGGMMSSRLFIKVREELSLAYYVQAGAASNPDTGYLVANAGLDNKKIFKGIEAILTEFKKLKEEKVSEKELQKAKDYMKGKTALSLESTDSLAFYYGRQSLLEDSILTPEKLFLKIDSVTSDDIFRVANDIFLQKKLNLALIGPFDDKKEFEKMLKDNL